MSVYAFASSSVILFLLHSFVMAHTIHIAPVPLGNDANAGTAEKPVATPQRAQALLREITAAGLSEPVNVVFADGAYFLDEPIELRPEDSGTAACPVTWKAAAGAKPLLSGGRRITGKWLRGERGIWHVDLNGVGLGAGEWYFRQLFVEGRRAIRARFPNADAPNPFLYAIGGDKDHILIDPPLVKPSWGDAPDVQINIVPQWKFFNQWNTVTKVDPVSGRIDIADSERHAKVTDGNWFWVEGVPEELDRPGEWYLDPTTGRLSYMPEPGVDPNDLQIIAPRLNRIVNCKGDVNAGTHVKHVHFNGLTFQHTTFTLGQIEARVHTDTAIMFENTLDSSVTNCTFGLLGGYAMWLHLDSQRNVFDRNTVRDVGGGGVLLTGARLSYMDDSKIYTPGEAAAKVAPILNHITRNTVEGCGRLRYYGGGVHLDSRPFHMSMSPGNYIGHNYFSNLSRNGIFAFRNQGGNVIEYNHIHDAMQTTIDGACIHIATMNHLNAPNYILNNWLYDIWGYEQKPDGKPIRRLANGIFLDWDTSNTTCIDNWIYNAGDTPVKPIWNNHNLTLRDNPDSPTPITPPFAKELGPNGTATNGIDLAANKLTGSIIHYTNSDHFSTTGKWTPRAATGMWGLFVFNFLVGTADEPGEAVFRLPIAEDGEYEVWLLYRASPECASNASITVKHSGGSSQQQWNMREGSKAGFAVKMDQFRFHAGDENTVTFSTRGADGEVFVDGVAFVKSN